MMGCVEPRALNIGIDMHVCPSHFLFLSPLVTETVETVSVREQKVSRELLCSLTRSCKAEWRSACRGAEYKLP